MDLYKSGLTNSMEICWQIIKRNKLSINKDTVYRLFAEHPYPDSLMAITDILGRFNISTTSHTIKNAESLINCEGTFIVLVYIHSEPYFCIVETLTSQNIIWYNPIEHKREIISYATFENIYGGVITLVEVDDYVAETNYSDKKKKHIVKRCIEAIPTIISVMVCIMVLLIILSPKTSIYSGLYVAGLGIGSIICIVLLNYEVNDYKSSLIEKLCPVGGKWDCTTVLESSANNIYGLSWSTIGLTYFAGTLITMACMGNTSMNYYIMATYLNVFTLPFIIYSLYYQIVVYKHWCVMCLSVIGILVYLFILSFLEGFRYIRFDLIISIIAPFIIIDLMVLWGSNMYMGLKEQKKEYDKLFPSFNKIKYNTNVFHALLKEYPSIDDVPLEMSINIGEPTAPIKILKVCNPYCIACSKSHFVMEKLLKKGNVFMQVIFTVHSKENDTKKEVIKFFFALKEKYGNQYMEQVLNRWYSQEEKNLEEFWKKYEIEDKIVDMQEDKIKWMEKKTMELEIQYTPTFYINNHHLPDDLYSYNDFGILFES